MTQRIPANQLLIGAHTSIAGGVQNALLEGQSIGATTIQLFTSNQRQWKGRPISEEGVELFKKVRSETTMQSIMSHASYLINLGSPNPEILVKSRQAFREEIERCLSLNVNFLNFHPGAACGDATESALDRIIESLLLMEDLFVDDDTRLLIEATAGQGSCLGFSFEQLSYILEKTKSRLPIGVCIDTCHIFAAGYDIRTPEAWMETLKKYDAIVGLSSLYAFHLNDSTTTLGSRKDRHANLGEGEIGIESFKFLMHSELTRSIPKYLETPGGCLRWDKEIWMLREFAQ